MAPYPNPSSIGRRDFVLSEERRSNSSYVCSPDGRGAGVREQVNAFLLLALKIIEVGIIALCTDVASHPGGNCAVQDKAVEL
jgi:hypothetical protein